MKLMDKFIKNTLVNFIKWIRIFIKLKKLDIFFSKLLSIKFKKNRLEITTTIGCAMMCDYCPQTLIKSTLNNNDTSKDQKIMNYENFKLYFENISNKTAIHWSGYSEPLGNKDFVRFVNYLEKKNYEQHISTTMFGRRETEEFMASTKAFKSVTFHLPDSSNLMKLAVSDVYLKNLEDTMRFQSKRLSKKAIYIVVFGKNFHPKVEALISKLIDEKIISKNSVDIRDHLHSRNGDVVDMNDFRMDKTNLEEQNNKENKRLYYCSYGRLDQGVMLPNGDVNLCCQDYSLKGIIGNLKKENLKEIYKQKKIYQKDFMYGQYSLCRNCEYYSYV